MRRFALGLALVAGAALGAGATALAHRGETVAVVSLAPAPIASMKDWTAAAVKGQVAEIFGGKFIVADDSGRALVETGPAGDRAALVGKDETVIVQGRFEHGSLHAVSIQHADGRTEVVGPPGPPHGPPSLFGPHGLFTRL